MALVTGAARGIGAACALRLAADGYRVLVADVNHDGAQAQAAVIRDAGHDAAALQLDVSNPDEVRRAIAGEDGPHVLVNNAGIAGPAGPVVDYDIQEWRRVIDVDLTGVFLCCRAAIPHMLAAGWGRIVNIASLSGKEGNPNMAAYSAAKAGVIGFTKALAKELATTGVIVNCVTPTVIATEILKQLNDEAVNYMVSKIPMQRVGQAEEVASLVSWLAGEQCTFSTGAVFDISGGRATY